MERIDGIKIDVFEHYLYIDHIKIWRVERFEYQRCVGFFHNKLNISLSTLPLFTHLSMLEKWLATCWSVFYLSHLMTWDCRRHSINLYKMKSTSVNIYTCNLYKFKYYRFEILNYCFWTKMLDFFIFLNNPCFELIMYESDLCIGYYTNSWWECPLWEFIVVRHEIFSK